MWRERMPDIRHGNCIGRRSAGAMERDMPEFNLPLSGGVDQVFQLWTSLFRAVGSQFGLININLGQSSNPTVEEEVLADVASYGRQLGRIADALAVLLARLPPAAELTLQERDALA